MSDLDEFYGPNGGYVLDLYERYQQDPNAVDPATRAVFQQWPAPVSHTDPIPADKSAPLPSEGVGYSGARDSREAAGIRLRGGPAILFTLGSSVVNHPGEFWNLALQSIAPTDWTAILLGAPDDLPLPEALRRRVQVIPFAPYGDLFPHVDVIVHQGGVGTTQAACYYGIPSLIIPRGFDQFENAAHIQREGWGLRLLPQDLSAHSLRFRLERLLRSAEIKSRAAELGCEMRAEPGVTRSADLVEASLETL